MRENFPACMAIVKKWEGGNDDDPRDPGGRTSRGVIQREYDHYRQAKGQPSRDVWTMADAERDEIFKAGYWDIVSADQLPAGIDLVTFDPAINSGPAQGVKWLQRALGVADDGRVGLVTRDAAAVAARQPDNGAAVIQRACANRSAFLHRLRAFDHFGKGWMNRVADVEARAVAMLQAASPARPSKTLSDHAVEANNQRVNAATGATTTAAGAGAAATSSNTDLPWAVLQQRPWLAVLLFFACAAGVFVFARRARLHAIRAAAYRTVAAEQKDASP